MTISTQVGEFGIGNLTANANTAFTGFIPPFRGYDGAPLIYSGGPGNATPNWWSGPSATRTRISTLVYTTTGATAHALTLMRPLNFAYVSSVAAINQAVINIDKDPGVYSTNYRYQTPGGVAPSQIANNVIAANDYCAYQLVDGTWILDTVASVSTLAITMTTNIPNITGGGVAAGAPFFFFGISTDKDPGTGQTRPQVDIPASTVQYRYYDTFSGIFGTIHNGDPCFVYSGNATNAGILDSLSGFFANQS